jgi:protein-S-isoprenylcysteine O-methyltransferase Ste14
VSGDGQYVGVTLIVIGLAVLPEERYLLEKFGESYAAYRARVRRYL